MIIFALILIVAIGEICFYFFYKPKTNVNKPYGLSNAVITPITEPEIPTPTSSGTASANIVTPTDRAIDENAIQNFVQQLRKIKLGLVSHTELNITLLGRIVQINYDEKINQNTDGKYKLYLKLRWGEAGYTQAYYFNENDLSKIEVVDKTGLNQKITYKDLKVNDEIKMSLTQDLLKPIDSNTISIIINKNK